MLAALATVGAAVGAAVHSPDGAIAIAAVAAVAAYVCFYLLRQRLTDPLTMAGRAALERVDTRILATGEWRGSEDISGVALHGLTKLPDRRLADTLRRDTRARTRSHAACCAPGRCGSYGSMSTPVLHGSGSSGASCGGFSGFGAPFSSGGSHSGGGHGGSDFGGGDSEGGGGGGCGGT
ncbi:hypothetical protein FE391_01550 [Nonomuraea sp. KC401]|uniref:hypothetical protein n=1 Tax=Nonomuraea sp. KC401 TaxID=1848324 RepID=UPI0010FD28A4|nr:hypothetical protein [Nonomuraea sp. KC401]TLF85645.1 hypothetical protein FE391_01550 [Nonomuraea sp. KC401]